MCDVVEPLYGICIERVYTDDVGYFTVRVCDRLMLTNDKFSIVVLYSNKVKVTGARTMFGIAELAENYDVIVALYRDFYEERNAPALTRRLCMSQLGRQMPVRGAW